MLEPEPSIPDSQGTNIAEATEFGPSEHEGGDPDTGDTIAQEIVRRISRTGSDAWAQERGRRWSIVGMPVYFVDSDDESEIARSASFEELARLSLASGSD